MSILTHSIPANGQPLLAPKGTGTPDVCQNLSMAQSFHGAHSMKSFQTNSLKKTSLAIANGEPAVQGESVCNLENSINGISNLSHLLSNESVTSTMHIDNAQFEPIAHNFLCSLSENGKFVRVDNYLSSTPNIVLSVAVSSAVKLDGRQIELIARKMQRLTGFRNLRLDNIVDPSLIAGFLISYGDGESQIIDLSVKGQLAALAARVESSDQRLAVLA